MCTIFLYDLYSDGEFVGSSPTKGICLIYEKKMKNIKLVNAIIIIAIVSILLSGCVSNNDITDSDNENGNAESEAGGNIADNVTDNIQDINDTVEVDNGK